MLKKFINKERGSEDNIIKQFYKNISCIVSSEDVVQEVPDTDSNGSGVAFSAQVIEDIMLGKESDSEGTHSLEESDSEEEDQYVPFEPEHKVFIQTNTPHHVFANCTYLCIYCVYTQLKKL